MVTTCLTSLIIYVFVYAPNINFKILLFLYEQIYSDFPHLCRHEFLLSAKISFFKVVDHGVLKNIPYLLILSTCKFSKTKNRF